MGFFAGQRGRFDRIIRGETDRHDLVNRPHVRFSGATLEELKERWFHAENDALGYFLWLYSRLAREGIVDVAGAGRELDVLSIFPKCFEKIEYWQDRDHGHWEETAKVLGIEHRSGGGGPTRVPVAYRAPEPDGPGQQVFGHMPKL